MRENDFVIHLECEWIESWYGEEVGYPDVKIVNEYSEDICYGDITVTINYYIDMSCNKILKKWIDEVDL